VLSYLCVPVPRPVTRASQSTRYGKATACGWFFRHGKNEGHEFRYGHARVSSALIRPAHAGEWWFVGGIRLELLARKCIASPHVFRFVGVSDVTPGQLIVCKAATNRS
jgi:hypothetical protein